MSLALLLSSSEIISRISSGEQSSRNMEFLLEGRREGLILLVCDFKFFSSWGFENL